MYMVRGCSIVRLFSCARAGCWRHAIVHSSGIAAKYLLKRSDLQELYLNRGFAYILKQSIYFKLTNRKSVFGCHWKTQIDQRPELREILVHYGHTIWIQWIRVTRRSEYSWLVVVFAGEMKRKIQSCSRACPFQCGKATSLMMVSPTPIFKLTWCVKIDA